MVISPANLPEIRQFVPAQMTVLSIFFQVFMVLGKYNFYGMCTFFYVPILLGKIYLLAQCIFVIKSIVLLHRRCTSWNKLATILQYIRFEFGFHNIGCVIVHNLFILLLVCIFSCNFHDFDQKNVNSTYFRDIISNWGPHFVF